jgi:hypothetical protein
VAILRLALLRALPLFVIDRMLHDLAGDFVLS